MHWETTNILCDLHYPNICFIVMTWSSQTFFPWAPKLLQMVSAAMKLKKRLLLERKAMTNLDNILKSRDISLPAKVCRVKAMVFPVVMYRCEC